MQQSTGQKIIDTIGVPLSASTIAYLASMMFWEDTPSNRIKIFGKELSNHMGMALVVGGSSLVSEFASEWILPLLPNNASYSDFEGKAVPPIVTGASALAFLYFTDPSKFKDWWMKVFILGAGSQVGGKYLNETLMSFMNGNKA